ncbi:uncharacterized protein LOC127287190 [Leptopilina boulardi]|uniref:uncharacterized protein LOC127287190 n=1 Tax=Leptopilina boulardi TaxID=63433 RepID=UPI0021F553E3|nr:uncharacterized protein LOC127287190 [Leptopilina boulardi]
MNLLFRNYQLILLILICFQGKSYSKNWNSFHNVVRNYLESNPRIWQTLLIVNDSRNDEFVNLHNTPMIVVDIRNLTENHLLSRESNTFLRDPQSTLFIVTCLSLIPNQLALMSQIINFITQHTASKRRPKVLIAKKIEKNLINKELLTFMWSKQFLDVSILELENKRSKIDFFTYVNEITITRLLFYNPFTKKLHKQKMTSKLNLFPDKLKNVHKHPFIVGYYNDPPFVNITRNSTDNVTNIDGTDVLPVRAYADAKNFQLDERISINYFDTVKCIKENNTGFVFDIMNNRMQLIGSQSVRLVGCFALLMELAKTNERIYYYALVPKSVKSMELSDNWKILNVLIVISLLTLVWISSKLLRFDKIYWQILYLGEMALGMGVPHEPNYLSQRILFGAMMWSCFFFSSEIYSTFTSVSLPVVSTSGMDSLEDLYASNLVLFIHPNLYNIKDIKIIDSESSRIFYNKTCNDPILGQKCLRLLLNDTNVTEMLNSNITELSEGDDKMKNCIVNMLGKKNVKCQFNDDKKMTKIRCINDMLENKNVTCIMNSDRGVLIIRDTKRKYKKATIKAIKETVYVRLNTYLFEYASPYVASFEDVYMKLNEAGILQKWHNQFLDAEGSDKTSLFEVVPSEAGGETKLKDSLIHVLIFGFTFSAIVFIGEICFYNFHRFRQSRLLVIL